MKLRDLDIIVTAPPASCAVKWPERGTGAPLSSGLPSALHFCRPPSSSATWRAPKLRSMYQARALVWIGLLS